MMRATLITFVVCVLCVSIEGTINLTYILVRNNTKVRPICLAQELETYAAVGWIYPIPQTQKELPVEEYNYIPTSNHDFNCKFSSSDNCVIKWTLKNWQVDDNSSRTRAFLDDNRWEGLDTILISNNTKEFEQRFHIEAAQNNGFSVRAAGSVEIFLCIGWDPNKYPCYYLEVSKSNINLSKFPTMEKFLDKPKLAQYQAPYNIVAEDEWRNFEISVDENGKVLLVDKNIDRTVIEYVDSEPLKPMYLLLRSAEPSLWKISENHFMYTTKPQISRMGPQISYISHNLCVSLFVSTCSICKMTFFYMNGNEKIILKDVPPTDDKWIDIKLKKENIGINKVNVFVETNLVGEGNETEGWWAYDDVRLCIENELKITALTQLAPFEEDDTTVDMITCQLIKKPSFRPQKLDYELDEVSLVTTRTMVDETTIQVSLKNTDPDEYITYFVTCQGTPECSDNIQNANSIQARSVFFAATKQSELQFNNLIPYTKYVLQVTSVLDFPHWDFINVRTLETEEPTPEELPLKINIQTTDSTVNVSWAAPNCNDVRGRLIYVVTVFSKEYDYNQTLEYQTGNAFNFTDLHSYTPHTVRISTARNARAFQNEGANVLEYNFTTSAGVAPAVTNAEVYAIGPEGAYFRFNLPPNPKGIPSDMRITTCNKLSYAKCRSIIFPLKKCVLWKDKFCAEATNVLPKQAYLFKISIKNRLTSDFGQEVTLNDYSVDKVPTPPTNILYNVVDCDKGIDYCHVNISWRHPYFPNGTIDAFYITLNNTNVNTNVREPLMEEVYKILNGTYIPRYTRQIKYVPYGQTYNISIKSANSKYRSAEATAQVKMPNLAQYIDQKPKLLAAGPESFVFKLAPLDARLESYTVTVAVQDFNKTIPVNRDDIENKILLKNLCRNYGMTWVLQTIQVHPNKTSNLTINNLDEKNNLKPNTTYCLTFLIMNKYHGTEHFTVNTQQLHTPEMPTPPPPTTDASPSSAYNHLYMLLLLLLLVPIGFLIYRYVVKRRNSNRAVLEQKNKDNVYETLPFEEYEAQNAVSNNVYDHLKH